MNSLTSSFQNRGEVCINDSLVFHIPYYSSLLVLIDFPSYFSLVPLDSLFS